MFEVFGDIHHFYFNLLQAHSGHQSSGTDSHSDFEGRKCHQSQDTQIWVPEVSQLGKVLK